MEQMIEMEIPCAQCGKNLKKQVEESALAISVLIDRMKKWTICDQCRTAIDDRHDRENAEKLLRDRKAHWARICPEIYREFDLGQCRQPETSKRIIEWEPVNGRGLLVVGKSRAGKTRAAYAMVERHYLRGSKVVALRGTKWTELAIAKAKGGEDSHESKRIISAAMNADLTFIDDFAKNRWTETTEVAFWDLLEDRGSRRKPLVLTCTETGDAMMERMGHAAPDIISRLREFCDIIKFD